MSNAKNVAFLSTSIGFALGNLIGSKFRKVEKKETPIERAIRLMNEKK